jgi:hypothetical protein
MQNSRTIALELILEWVVVVGSRRSSLRGKLAVSGELTIGYVTTYLVGGAGGRTKDAQSRFGVNGSDGDRVISIFIIVVIVVVCDVDIILGEIIAHF